MPEAELVQDMIFAAESPQGPLTARKSPGSSCAPCLEQHRNSHLGAIEGSGAFCDECWGHSEMLPLLGDGHLERNWSSGKVCGEGGAGSCGLSLSLDPFIPLLAV